MRQEDLRMIKGEADPAPAKKWIGFGDGKKGQFLVAAGIKGADRNRLRSEGFKQIAVKTDIARPPWEACRAR